MNKVFLDTNVILDCYLPDRPEREASNKIMTISSDAECRLYFSVLSLANISYILRKRFGKEAATERIKELFNNINVLPMSDMDVYYALRSDSPDFEDALQISCADAKDCDCIITHNARHFKGYTPMPVFTPAEFLDGIRKATSLLDD